MRIQSGTRRSLPRLVLLTLACVWAGCGHPQLGAPGERVALVNVLPEFWSYREATRSLDRPAQVLAFRTQVVDRHAELFGPEVFGPGNDLDRHVERLVVEMPRLEPKMRALSERLPGEVDRTVERFRSRFPAFHWNGPVALSLSFSKFEMVWRTVEARRTLVIGVDTLAFYRGPYANLAPLLDHALAQAVLPDWPEAGPAPVWWELWKAGFPLQVARALNPDANDADLGLDPRAQDPSYLAALARRVRSSLDSVREADRRLLAAPVPGSESRLSSGAVLGLRVAQRVSAGRSLPEAARLSGPALRQAINSALASVEVPGALTGLPADAATGSAASSLRPRPGDAAGGPGKVPSSG